MLRIFITVISMFILTNHAFADQQNKVTEEQIKKHNAAIYKARQKYNKAIAEYRAYLANVPEHIRQEIVKYRKDIAAINQRKKVLFHSLSQEAQNYLKHEQQFKKKLPVKPKKPIISSQSQSHK